MEHGGDDDDPVTSWSAVHYYHRAEPAALVSDTLVVGDPDSEAAHDYSIVGQTRAGSNTSSFEGEFDKVVTTATGRAHQGMSAFTMQVDPANRGVLLRRMFDQDVANHAHMFMSMETMQLTSTTLVATAFTSGGRRRCFCRRRSPWGRARSSFGSNSSRLNTIGTNSNIVRYR
jgi:hypothetical protein